MKFERREWTLAPENAKNKKQFVIPLTEQVAAWFVELRRLAFDSGSLLPLRQRHRGRTGDAPMEATSLNAAFTRLHDKPGDRCRRFTPHDLRSTARSHLGMLGVDGSRSLEKAKRSTSCRSSERRTNEEDSAAVLVERGMADPVPIVC